MRGGDKSLADVPDDDYYAGCEVTDLMGRTAIEVLQDSRARLAADGGSSVETA